MRNLVINTLAFFFVLPGLVALITPIAAVSAVAFGADQDTVLWLAQPLMAILGNPNVAVPTIFGLAIGTTMILALKR